MSRGINKVILVGNLGQDPEVRSSANGGTQIANLSVATSESWKDKATGNMQERTEWHRVVMFGRLAEISGQYLKKGSKVYIEGKLQTRSWDDKATGQKRYSTEVLASEMQMLDSRGMTQSAPTPQASVTEAPTQERVQAKVAAPAPALAEEADMDIPF